MKHSILRGAVALMLLFSLTQCRTKALITCGNVETIATSFGYLDNAQIGLANVFIIDTINKKLKGWKQLHFSDADIETSPQGNITIAIQDGFNVTLSGSQAQSGIQANLKTAIANSMGYHLVNYNRQQFNSLNTVINEVANSTIINEFKSAANKGVIVGIVFAVFKGDSALIYLNKSRAVNGSFGKQQFLDISVDVSYNCSGNFEKYGESGKPTLLFYKPQFFVCDPLSGLIDITATSNFDLTKFASNGALEMK